MSITNLNAERAIKSGDCRNWTVRECLEEALKQISEGKFSADMVYIAFRKINEETNKITFLNFSAGVTQIECHGLLVKHLLNLDKE